jgi:hypothetical protein
MVLAMSSADPPASAAEGQSASSRDARSVRSWNPTGRARWHELIWIQWSWPMLMPEAGPFVTPKSPGAQIRSCVTVILSALAQPSALAVTGVG